MSDPEISRIVVETEAGWLRIKENVDKAIQQATEARLALLPGGKDGDAARRVRKEVESRIGKVQESMWDMSAHNLRVNGHDYEHYIQATEMFDEALDRHLWAKEEEKISWELKVSGYRKERPAWLVRLEEDIQRRRAYAEWYPEGDDDETDKKTKKAADIPKPPRHGEVIRTFQQVVENISELSNNVPQQMARAQRAKNVREEIASLPQ